MALDQQFGLGRNSMLNSGFYTIGQLMVFGEIGFFITILYIIFLIYQSFISKTRNFYVSFSIILVYYLFFAIITSGMDNSFLQILNFLWFVPILTSIIFEIIKTVRIKAINIQNKSYTESKYNLIYGFVTILAIFYIFGNSIMTRFWYSGGREFIKNLQGDYYYNAKLYDKSLDVYLDIQHTDGVTEKIVNVYINGSKYYYDNKEYRKCIELIERVIKDYNKEYNNNVSLDESIKKYILLSYVELYKNTKRSKDKNELFKIYYEITQKYNLDDLSSFNLNLDLDFNKYEILKYVNEEYDIRFNFGRIGYTEAGYENNKIDVPWRYLYRDDNRLYLICSFALSNRYLNINDTQNMNYNDTDMHCYLNDYLFNTMFTDDEKNSLLNIYDNEKITLLYEELMNDIYNNSGKYLNKLLSNVPILKMDRTSNVFTDQKFWLRSDIVDKKGKYVSLNSSNEIELAFSDANNYDIEVLPIICFDINKINDLSRIENKKILSNKQYVAAKELQKSKMKEETKLKFDNELHDKIKAMKKISEYANNATIDDFDTIFFGSNKLVDSSISPISWILLDKTDDKALLLSKYSLFNIDFCDTIEFGLNDFLFKYPNGFSYNDFSNDIAIKNYYNKIFNEIEIQHILESEIIISDNDKYNEYNDLSTMNDKLFLLSINDVKKYFTDKNGNILNNKLATVYYNCYDDSNIGNDSTFWLRDIGELWWTIAYVDEKGNLNERGLVSSCEIGYRPALWISY